MRWTRPIIGASTYTMHGRVRLFALLPDRSRRGSGTLSIKFLLQYASRIQVPRSVDRSRC